jgi:hypothetical protein
MDAVLLDARIPDMTPAAFLDELRRVDVLLARKVVLACQNSDTATSSGAARSMVKPIRRTVLLSAMDELLAATNDRDVMKLLN